ncbi:calcium-binding protein, partial [Amphritea balenae]
MSTFYVREEFLDAWKKATDVKSVNEAKAILDNPQSFEPLEVIKAAVTVADAIASNIPADMNTTKGLVTKAVGSVTGSLSLALNVADIADKYQSGKAKWTDVAGIIGSLMLRVPGLQVVGAILSAYPLADEFGQWLGKEGHLDPLFELYDNAVDSLSDLLFYLFGPDYNPASAFPEAAAKGSPIAIDLDGDGIETLSKTGNVFFDHDKNGMAERSGWIAADDGLLVLDRNADGQINNGGELFGNNTELADGTLAANGYEALKALDDNGDGVIDSNDASFADLRIWQDLNGDGLSQTDELLTLEQAGIASLNTDYQNSNSDDGYGNITRQTSTATMADGSTADTADIWFAVNKTRTVEQDLLELSDEVAALPDAVAFGNVRSLRQAMVRDEELTQLVQQFTDSDSEGERLGLMDALIWRWAGVDDVDPRSRDEFGTFYLDGRKVAALEQLIGQQYINRFGGNYVQGPQAAGVLGAEYNRVKSYIYAQLQSQTLYAEAFDQIGLAYNFDTDQFEPDLSDFKQYILDGLEQGSLSETDAIKIFNTFNGVASYSTILQTSLNTLKGDTELGAYVNTRAIIGTDIADQLSGSSQDDFIAGGQGDDSLNGGAGNDTYLFERGDGSDNLFDTAGSDQISFAEGILPEHIQLSRTQTSLIITINDPANPEQNDRIEILHYFDFDGNTSANAIEQLLFKDGQSIALSNLITEQISNQATVGDDYLYGDAAGNELSGLTGNDILYGGAGDDTYRFNIGDGKDVITDTAGADQIIFGAGITQDNIRFTRTDADLFITLIDESKTPTGDEIRIKGAVGQSRYTIESVLFNGQTNLTFTEMMQRSATLHGTDQDDQLTGIRLNDEIYGYAGNDTLNGGSGNDLLEGGAGDDSLNAGDGNDQLEGGEGNDTLQARFGHNSLSGGDGDDVLKIDRYSNGYSQRGYSNTLVGGLGNDRLEGW